jgi:putative sugar O-methyltransferase
MITDKPYANQIEYLCIKYGGWINALINLSQTTYQNTKITTYPLSDIVNFTNQPIAIDTTNRYEIRDQITALGIPLQNIALIPENIREFVAMLEQNSTILCKRIHTIEKEKLITYTHKTSLNGKQIEDVPSELPHNQHQEILRAVFESYKAMSSYDKVPEGLKVGENWKGFMAATRPNFYKACADGDFQSFANLISSFFRNEVSSGIFGGEEAFNAFSESKSEYPVIRNHYDIWKSMVPNASISELARPKVGNPYGVKADDNILHANDFFNHYRGSFVKELLSDTSHPIVAELGGGYGGLAYFIMQQVPNSTYINFDLPENLIISAYYIKASYPDKKVLIFDGSDKPLLAESLKEYDAVFMPHYMISQLEDLSVDLFVNTISLSEMDYRNIEIYIKHIRRTTKRYFYHENMIDSGANYNFYPASVFPELAEFKSLFKGPSRWPAFNLNSSSLCHMEQLYERKK